MTAVGFSACLAGLRVSTEPWIFAVGLIFITWQWALLYHMLLAFPDGTLHSQLERLLVTGMYFSAWDSTPSRCSFRTRLASACPRTCCSSTPTPTSRRRSAEPGSGSRWSSSAPWE